MAIIHNLGFSRIGARRELKQSLEAYWRGDIDQRTLHNTGRELRHRHWQLQQDAGLNWIPVGDFAWYDHVLQHCALLGVIPSRFDHPADQPADLDTLFRMARGRAPSGEDVAACEMTKWFDTNYHYLVPELSADQRFHVHPQPLLDEIHEAIACGITPKPVLIGPLTFLWLSKAGQQKTFDKLALLPALLEAYRAVLHHLANQGLDWVQIDEPILALDLPKAWQKAFETSYHHLAQTPLKLLLATYFGDVSHHIGCLESLPVAGLHIDIVRAPKQWQTALDRLSHHKVLSLGIIDGRNIWRTDLRATLNLLTPLQEKLGNRLWLAPSCSLLHVPVDLDSETELDPVIKPWLAFGKQKLHELQLLQAHLNGTATVQQQQQLQENEHALQTRRTSERVTNSQVQQRISQLSATSSQRTTAYAERAAAQHQKLQLPLLPTTTIGSFPQTSAIRNCRKYLRHSEISQEEYRATLQQEIARVIRCQEELDLDVLVHGEAERNDMVEYFGEQLSGFLFTSQGWVQSYGSRCVKPPIIYGDVSRPSPMTCDWARYAQSLTQKPVKGMLTGPVTILGWSFTRDDIPLRDSCYQIALALRDEVNDLEQAGIAIIQIDEPAFRERLPLRQQEQADYLEWAAECFRLSASGVDDSTQIHTHMCYSAFNAILPAIAAMDADVITIETSRSNMELLQAFSAFSYPNEIGPGVYDIHSPREPDIAWMQQLIRKAAEYIPIERLWINPDCGLKTRSWQEAAQGLSNMVIAAKALRQELQEQQQAPRQQQA